MSSMFCHAVVLALSCFGTLSSAQVIAIHPLNAAPRWGNSNCWVDTGGRLKNGCRTTQLLTLPVDEHLVNKTVKAYIYTDAPFAKLECQHASLDPSPTPVYWAVDYLMGNGPVNGDGGSSVYLPPWKVPYHFYQIDCHVPPGVQVFGALVYWQ